MCFLCVSYVFPYLFLLEIWLFRSFANFLPGESFLFWGYISFYFFQKNPMYKFFIKHMVSNDGLSLSELCFHFLSSAL